MGTVTRALHVIENNVVFESGDHLADITNQPSFDRECAMWKCSL
jgi:hypothetical protein